MKWLSVFIIINVMIWSAWSQDDLVPPPDLTQDDGGLPPLPPPSGLPAESGQNDGSKREDKKPDDKKADNQGANQGSGGNNQGGNLPIGGENPANSNVDEDGQVVSPFGSDLSGTDSQTAELRESVLQEFLQPYGYTTDGRRDPFAQPVIERPLDPLPKHGPVLPLRTVRLDQIQVRAILWNVANPKAILQLPSGNIVTVKLKDRLGSNNGYVAAIREGEIVLVETFEEGGRIFSSTKILTLNK